MPVETRSHAPTARTLRARRRTIPAIMRTPPALRPMDAFDTPHASPPSSPLRTAWEEAQTADWDHLTIDVSPRTAEAVPVEPTASDIRASWPHEMYQAYQIYACVDASRPGSTLCAKTQWRAALGIPNTMWEMIRSGGPLLINPRNIIFTD